MQYSYTAALCRGVQEGHIMMARTGEKGTVGRVHTIQRTLVQSAKPTKH